MLARLSIGRVSSSLPVEAALVDLETPRITLIAWLWITFMSLSYCNNMCTWLGHHPKGDGAILQCWLHCSYVHLPQDSRINTENVPITFKAFSFCCALDQAYFACDANVNCLSTITPMYLTSLNHRIGCLLMLKVQLGSAYRKYTASAFSGANFRPSVETIMFNAAEGWNHLFPQGILVPRNTM